MPEPSPAPPREPEPSPGMQLASSAVDDLTVASGLLRREEGPNGRPRMNRGQLHVWLAITEVFVAMIEELEG